jgi:heme o synthase
MNVGIGGRNAGAIESSLVWALPRSSIRDYIELMKPRLALLVLVTTGVGFWLGARGLQAASLVAFSHALAGTALVAAGALVLNQYLERSSDALMRRTRMRPLPTGRVRPRDALTFGLLLSGAGVLYLSAAVNLVAAVLAALSLASYVLLYTPLKMRTPLCTLVGAIAGAIPPMIGYAAATGRLDMRAWSLFLILFIWQMPHFLAIAWLYREDYARAGQMVLPVVDASGALTARQIVLFSLALLPATLLPGPLGLAGTVYTASAVALGAAFLFFGAAVAVRRTRTAARRLFLASVLYLPLLLMMMVLDRPTA